MWKRTTFRPRVVRSAARTGFRASRPRHGVPTRFLLLHLGPLVLRRCSRRSIPETGRYPNPSLDGSGVACEKRRKSSCEEERQGGALPIDYAGACGACAGDCVRDSSMPCRLVCNCAWRVSVSLRTEVDGSRISLLREREDDGMFEKETLETRLLVEARRGTRRSRSATLAPAAQTRLRRRHQCRCRFAAVLPNR